MLISSSTRMWLGSAVLSGLILAFSLPVSATTQKASTKPRSVASIIVPTGSFTKAVRTQMQWNSSSITPLVGKDSAYVAAASNANDSTKVETSSKPQPAAQATVNNTRPAVVQVADTPQKQISRSDSSELVDHALSLQGVPYRFGGTSRSGFDCSGFTQYVYRSSNTVLPRTASEQFNVGSSVSRGQLQVGDLVFFSTYAQGASHVGIYIGGGRFVHASNSGVRVTSLSDSYYAGRYLGARRVK